MKKVTLNSAILCTALLISVTANANCDWDMQDGQKYQYQVAKVSSHTHRLYFYEKNEGYDKSCPKSDEYCKTKKYVIAGDEVLINHTNGKWACSWFSDKLGMDGWLKTDDLVSQNVNRNPNLSSWQGDWKVFENEITITKNGNKLEVNGHAIWDGGMGIYDYNEGDINGEMQPLNNKAHLTDTNVPECSADFEIVNKYLIVSNNYDQCGGLNVSFNGVYTKHK